jgi:hypothetical protein
MDSGSEHTSGIDCSCCLSRSCPVRDQAGSNRREFLAGVGAVTAAGLAISTLSGGTVGYESNRIKPIRRPLRVQPVLVYDIAKKREGVSWRNWGGIHTEDNAKQERKRISRELEEMKASADFPLEVYPVIAVGDVAAAQKVAGGSHDVLLMYAASGWVDVLEALSNPEKWTVVFLRHRSGPVYLWYEIISNRYLRKTVDEFGQPGVTTRDIVVDRYEEVLWRLRALSGLKNTLGKKVLCVGGPAGWGQGGRTAPEKARERFSMELVDISYDELGLRLEKARQNSGLVKWSEDQAGRYLAEEQVTLETSRDFVTKGFLLTEVFHDLLAEHKTDAITINQCMGTIMEVSETTACLPLSLMNDSGYMAFCESDFVVIPSGILLHYLSGKPVFFNDPTYPHDNLVTLAHCTAPRRMDGENLESVRILTHFESDWGAAPKVEMRLGEKITVIDPDFNFQRWLGFEGEIVGNPFLDICRSQIDVQFDCDTDKLNEETRGFHWMAGYGNYLKELEYAIKKTGIDWVTLA